MGAGNPPPALTGREAQEEQFRRLLGRLARGNHEPSMILSGLRGVGKTVLLLEFRDIAVGELGWVAAHPIEIKSDTDFRAELAEQIFRALQELSRSRAVGDRLKRFAKILNGFKFAAGADGSIEFTFDPAVADAALAATGDLERDLTALLVEVGAVAQEHDTGFLILIDEMQFLAKHEMEAVAAAMHRMSQTGLPVALVGTGLPQLPGLLVDAKSYAERLFSYPKLDRLDEASARAALVLPAQQHDVEFATASTPEQDPLARLLSLSGCYPAFIQAYGKGVWDAAETSPITVDDVEAAVPHVAEKLDREFFMTRFVKATPAEGRYMAAMAALGDGPQESGSVAALLKTTTSAQSVHRDALIKKGLIYSPQHRKVDFTVPHFAGFMRRHAPLSTAS
ncbi:MAG: ATP-binding protein [Patulibacter sp.]